MFARLSFAGAVMQAAVGFVGLAVWGVLAQPDTLAVVSDETMQTLDAFDDIIFFSTMAWPGRFSCSVRRRAGGGVRLWLSRTGRKSTVTPPN